MRGKGQQCPFSLNEALSEGIAEKARRLAGESGVAAGVGYKAGPGRGNKTSDKNEIVRPFGNSASYRIAKLKRDHPEIAERLAAGEFKSVSAAERAAGVVDDHRLTELEKALNRVSEAWSDASSDERSVFRQAMQKLDSEQPIIENPVQARLASDIKLTRFEVIMLRLVAEGCDVTDNMIYAALSAARGLDQSKMGVTKEGWLRHPDRPRLGELCAPSGRHGTPLMERRGSGSQRTYHLTGFGQEVYKLVKCVTPA